MLFTSSPHKTIGVLSVVKAILGLTLLNPNPETAYSADQVCACPDAEAINTVQIRTKNFEQLLMAFKKTKNPEQVLEQFIQKNQDSLKEMEDMTGIMSSTQFDNLIPFTLLKEKYERIVNKF